MKILMMLSNVKITFPEKKISVIYNKKLKLVSILTSVRMMAETPMVSKWLITINMAKIITKRLAENINRILPVWINLRQARKMGAAKVKRKRNKLLGEEDPEM